MKKRFTEAQIVGFLREHVCWISPAPAVELYSNVNVWSGPRRCSA
jgi:hypothetical protein